MGTRLVDQAERTLLAAILAEPSAEKLSAETTAAIAAYRDLCANRPRYTTEDGNLFDGEKLVGCCHETSFAEIVVELLNEKEKGGT